MGATKRFLDEVVEVMEGAGLFENMGMDEQFDEAVLVTQAVLRKMEQEPPLWRLSHNLEEMVHQVLC